jgi:hypothetical protein
MAFAGLVQSMTRLYGIARGVRTPSCELLAAIERDPKHVLGALAA